MRLLLFILLPLSLWGQPTTIDSLKLWLEHDLGFTPSSWADQSGNGFNALQGTVGAQPSLTDTSILFADDWMRVGPIQESTNRFWDDGYTVVVRYIIDASKTGVNSRVAVADSGAGGIRNWLLTKNTADSVQWVTLPPAQTPVDVLIGKPANAQFGLWNLDVLVYNGTVKSYYHNDTLRTSTPTGGVDNNDDPPVFVGSSPGGVSPLAGQISHLIIFSKALTDTERDLVTTYVTTGVWPATAATASENRSKYGRKYTIYKNY